MESKAKESCALLPSGSFVFQDDYGILYEAHWDTTASGLDITVTTREPHVWGEPDSGFVRNRTVFRHGIITVRRQIIRQVPEGFELVSEGGTQVIGDYQATFPCGPSPTDPFCYHLDNAVCDDIELISYCGPHWSDPDVPDESVWGDVDILGNVSPLSIQLFQWIDVWASEEILFSACAAATE